MKVPLKELYDIAPERSVSIRSVQVPLMQGPAYYREALQCKSDRILISTKAPFLMI